MAVRFVPCASKEHAVACREAGLLYINFSQLDMPDDWALAQGCDAAWVLSWYNNNNSHWPRAADFGVALED